MKTYGWTLMESDISWIPARHGVPDITLHKREFDKSVAISYIRGRIEETKDAEPKLFWDKDNSVLYRVESDGGKKMVGWCQRSGDRHKAIGWFAFVEGKGMIAFSDREPSWPKYKMARRAVIETVRGE